MMIHNASGYAQGEAADLRKMAELLDSTTANIASVYAERAGGTAKSWLKVMAEETWYSAEEAVAAGLADEVAPLPTEREAHKQAATFDLSVYAHAPKIAALIQPGVGETGPVKVTVKSGDRFDQAVLDAVKALPSLEQPQPVAVLDTEPIAWSADLFRNAITEAVPEPVTWDPDMFTAAVRLVTNNVPTPDRPPTPEPVPARGFDPNVFAQAIREARK
jgi:hypothetical protein